MLGGWDVVRPRANAQTPYRSSPLLKPSYWFLGRSLWTDFKVACDLKVLGLKESTWTNRTHGAILSLDATSCNSLRDEAVFIFLAQGDQRLIYLCFPYIRELFNGTCSILSRFRSEFSNQHRTTSTIIDFTTWSSFTNWPPTWPQAQCHNHLALGKKRPQWSHSWNYSNRQNVSYYACRDRSFPSKGEHEQVQSRSTHRIKKWASTKGSKSWPRECWARKKTASGTSNKEALESSEQTACRKEKQELAGPLKNLVFKDKKHFGTLKKTPVFW